MSISIALIILVTTALLYVFDYSEIYIMNWICKTVVPFILMVYLPENHKRLESINKKDKRNFYLKIIIGLLIMFIPGSKVYTSICKNISSSEYNIAEFLIYFCGVITIFLNKYIINKITGIKRWKIKM